MKNNTYVLHTVSRLGEVDVRVPEGAPGDHVSADPNGEHRAGWAEFLVQHRLRDVGVQVANVQRSHGIIPRRCVHISVFTKADAKTSSKMFWEKKNVGPHRQLGEKISNLTKLNVFFKYLHPRG